MDSVLHHRGRIGSRTLLLTTAAVPLTGGWPDLLEHVFQQLPALRP